MSSSEIKILVLDDDPFVLKLFPLFLAKLGFTEVAVSNSGLNALSWVNINNASSNLIFLDLNMPNMDGITLVKEVKKLPEYKFTPIIMLTTESQEGKKQEGQAAGAKAWVVKPFAPAQMLAAVSKLVAP